MKQHTQCWSKFSKVSSPQGGEVNSQKSDRLRVAKMQRMSWIAGVLNCRSFCPKEPLITGLFCAKEPLSIGLFCGKWPIQIRHHGSSPSCTQFTMHSILPRIQCTIHPVYCTLSWIYTQFTAHSIHYTLNWLHTQFAVHSIYYTLNLLYTRFTMHPIYHTFNSTHAQFTTHSDYVSSLFSKLHEKFSKVGFLVTLYII